MGVRQPRSLASRARIETNIARASAEAEALRLDATVAEKLGAR
jgi:hypothetical protein